MTEHCDELALKEYMEKIIRDPLKKFELLVKWSEETKSEFKSLLDKLKSSAEGETTTEVGDRLEKVVEFIINKSFFYEVYKKIHTATNEIDEVIIFSDRGKQALKSFGISRDIIPISQDLILGECKNYASGLGVTYVGKFYSLMTVADVDVGILFTQKGLTGRPDGYKDAYGLTKILKLVEKGLRNRDFYILTFSLEDYEKLLERATFFELLRAKMLELRLASDYHHFLKENRHENEEQIKNIIKDIQ